MWLRHKYPKRFALAGRERLFTTWARARVCEHPTGLTPKKGCVGGPTVWGGDSGEGRREPPGRLSRLVSRRPTYGAVPELSCTLFECTLWSAVGRPEPERGAAHTGAQHRAYGTNRSGPKVVRGGVSTRLRSNLGSPRASQRARSALRTFEPERVLTPWCCAPVCAATCYGRVLAHMWPRVARASTL